MTSAAFWSGTGGDDRPENTEAPRKLGMEAVTVKEGSEEFLLRELMKLL